MLISVHVPKTGGTSFTELLAACYGERLFLDYGDGVMNHGLVMRALGVAGHLIRPQQGLSERYDCIHGHFLPLRYSLLKRASFLIWLRDPVERVVSRYYHYRNHCNTDSVQFRKYQKRQDLSLHDFVQIKHYQNLYAKYLLGMKLERFDFIGITENYAKSVEVFLQIYNLDESFRPALLNRNPEKGGRTSYALSEETRELILQCNRKDAAIYRRARKINQALERRYLVEAPSHP